MNQKPANTKKFTDQAKLQISRSQIWKVLNLKILFENYSTLPEIPIEREMNKLRVDQKRIEELT